MAEYIWIGGFGDDIRSKTMTLDDKSYEVSELPIWNYDGSSTNQAPGDDSEILLQPVRIYADPFRGGNNILVLCCTCLPNGEPAKNNNRYFAEPIFNQALDEHPWFGIEQEYTLFEADGRTPLGWPTGGYPGPQGPYYCGVGADKAYGRFICDLHMRVCIHAGVQVSGTNAEVMPGQWEYQVGPCEGIKSGDDLWISRYLLQRVCEDSNVVVSFDPKPIPGDWNGAGCHTNYSTAKMRAEGGLTEILAAIEKLGKKHDEHIAAYGSGNERRLLGSHETASISKFSYGVANRGASIRIPRNTEKAKRGYLEDRRPSANMDPYVVTGMIFRTTVLE